MDILNLTESIFTRVQQYVQPALDKLVDQIEKMGERSREHTDAQIKALPTAEKGKDGADGKSAYEIAVSLGFQGDVYDFLKSIAGRDGPAGPQGERGLQGEQGAIGDPGPSGPIGERGLQGERGETGEIGPAGPQGDQGIQGERGEAGPAGKDADMAEVRAILVEIVAGTIKELKAEMRSEIKQMVEAIPRPKDGAPGPKGEQGEAGLPGAAGAQGEPGKSITIEDVQPILENMQAKWILDFERSARAEFQRYQDEAKAELIKAIDSIPLPKDGRDGLGFEDMSVEQLDERTLCLRFVRGDLTREFTVRIPGLHYREVYSISNKYLQDDVVTYGGSLWIAVKDDPDGRPGDSKDWKLAVKKGRDGK